MTAQTQLTPITAEELLERGNEFGRCELIRGEVVQMAPAGAEHGELAINWTLALGQYVREHRLGKIYAAETGFILARKPDTVRAPDVAFVSVDRLPPQRRKGFFEGAPDLAVEVLSPGDSAGEVAEKVQEWLQAGCQLVWVADPRTRTVTAYRADGSARVYRMGDSVEGEAVVPGFRLSVEQIFE